MLLLKVATVKFSPLYSSVLPMFFEKSLWRKVVQVSQVMSAMVVLCVSGMLRKPSVLHPIFIAIGERPPGL